MPQPSRGNYYLILMRSFKHIAGNLLLVVFFAIAFNSCKENAEPPSEIPFSGFDSIIHFNPDIEYGTMTDQDGIVYKTITITRKGKEFTWMAENLRTTKYADGTNISNVTSVTDWYKLSQGGYCNYNNTTNADSIRVYGRLYNNFAVGSTKKLAPVGWHIADTLDWLTLLDTSTLSLGKKSFLGGRLKEAGLTHWQEINTGAVNDLGFTAIPAGYRTGQRVVVDNKSVIISPFQNIGKSCVFWTPHSDASDAKGINILYNTEYCFGVTPTLTYPRKYGFSVRCVKNYN